MTRRKHFPRVQVKKKIIFRCREPMAISTARHPREMSSAARTVAPPRPRCPTEGGISFLLKFRRSAHPSSTPPLIDITERRRKIKGFHWQDHFRWLSPGMLPFRRPFSPRIGSRHFSALRPGLPYFRNADGFPAGKISVDFLSSFTEKREKFRNSINKLSSVHSDCGN